MLRRLSSVAAACCLCALAPHAVANGISLDKGFDALRRGAASDRISLDNVRLEYHHEWRQGGVTHHEWLVAAFDAPVRGEAIERLAAAFLQGHRAQPRHDSWHEALNRDWGDKFQSRWGRESHPRNVGRAWLERYCVSAVPEPGSTALMLSGLGIIGVAARRRSTRGV